MPGIAERVRLGLGYTKKPAVMTRSGLVTTKKGSNAVVTPSSQPWWGTQGGPSNAGTLVQTQKNDGSRGAPRYSTWKLPLWSSAKIRE